MKRKICGELLGIRVVNIQFYHLYFVFTAAITVGGRHAAFTAFFGIGFAPLHAIQPVHAIMDRNHKSRTYGKINEECYGDQEIFHS